MGEQTVGRRVQSAFAVGSASVWTSGPPSQTCRPCHRHAIPSHAASHPQCPLTVCTYPYPDTLSHQPRPSTNITFLYLFLFLKRPSFIHLTQCALIWPAYALKSLLKLIFVFQSRPFWHWWCWWKAPPFEGFARYRLSLLLSHVLFYLLFLYIGQTVLIIITILLFQMEKEKNVLAFFFLKHKWTSQAKFFKTNFPFCESSNESRNGYMTHFPIEGKVHFIPLSA